MEWVDMSKGQKYPSEKAEHDGKKFGRKVSQLTNQRGWHIIPYFTNTAFTPDSKTIAFHSNRHGKTDIFTVEIRSGEITQLTDIPPNIPAPSLRYFQEGEHYPRVRCDLVSWIDRTVYFHGGNEFRRVSIDTLEEEVLWRVPDDIIAGLPHMNSDGTLIVFPAMDVELFNIAEDEKPQFQHSVWRRVKENPYLMSYLIVLDLTTRKVAEWTRENSWISHAQFSPLDSKRILYCHEGVWEDVDDRIWMFDRTTGEKWNLRKQTSDVCIGHEMWITGTERVLYHGWIGEKTMFGFINADGSDMVEYLADSRFYGHFCPNRYGSVLVTDAGIHKDMISLVTFEDGKVVFEPLCRHGSIWKHGWDHPHPHFSPDGKWIVFTASHSIYNSDIYLVEVPEKYRR
jgi:oligogalacturonide lyase